MDFAFGEEEIEELVATQWTLRLATHGPGERLHLTALWYCWAGGRFYAFTRGQKLVNLRRNANCTVLVDRGKGYPELRGVMLHARGRILEDADAEAEDAYLDSVVRDAMGEKYAEGDAPGGGSRNESTAFRDWRWIVIEPESSVSWDNRKA
ncbi:MAG: pyridoxamine 5'-phosphate oxidase family protein [Deltaproteobacteria bacterium]|nr:pyridoxamine 5'-phosphate oxidase family protein [Deltaproteobacteria bacterium]